MGDGSRQRFFLLSEEKKIKIKIHSLAIVGKFVLFSRDFDDFLTELLHSKKRTLHLGDILRRYNILTIYLHITVRSCQLLEQCDISLSTRFNKSLF